MVLETFVGGGGESQSVRLTADRLHERRHLEKVRRCLGSLGKEDDV